MCLAIQQMRDDAMEEGKIEGKIDAERNTAMRQLRDGIITIGQISTYFPSLSADDIEKLEAEVLQYV